MAGNRTIVIGMIVAGVALAAAEYASADHILALPEIDMPAFMKTTAPDAPAIADTATPSGE